MSLKDMSLEEYTAEVKKYFSECGRKSQTEIDSYFRKHMNIDIWLSPHRKQ